MLPCEPIEKSPWKSSFGLVQAGERIADNGEPGNKGSDCAVAQAGVMDAPGQAGSPTPVTGFPPTRGVVERSHGSGGVRPDPRCEAPYAVLLPGSSVPEDRTSMFIFGAVFFAGGVRHLVGLNSLVWHNWWSAHRAPG